MPMTPEFVRCEPHEVIGLPGEQLTKGSELSLRESIEKGACAMYYHTQ